jgi:carbon-monoxide dehydrogenase medium subunit
MYRTDYGDLLSVTQAELPPFRLARPTSVEEALAVLATAPRPAVIHAGGTDLFARFRTGLRPATMVHIGRIAELRTIAQTDSALHLGAGARHGEVVAHPALRRVPGLVEAWSRIATTRIRATATLGGNLMARHTRYELSILLSALRAEALLAGPEGRSRRVPVEAIWAADLEATPLLLGVSVPLDGAPRLDYERSQRPRFTQALARRDGPAEPALRFVIATEYCRPWIMHGSIGTNSDQFLEGLPADFGDSAVSRAHLVRAGAAFLRRQMTRLEAQA